MPLVGTSGADLGDRQTAGSGSTKVKRIPQILGGNFLLAVLELGFCRALAARWSCKGFIPVV